MYWLWNSGDDNYDTKKDDNNDNDNDDNGNIIMYIKLLMNYFINELYFINILYFFSWKYFLTNKINIKFTLDNSFINY